MTLPRRLDGRRQRRAKLAGAPKKRSRFSAKATRNQCWKERSAISVLINDSAASTDGRGRNRPVDARPHCHRARFALYPREARPDGPVAQWLEPAAHNGLVAGSSPARPTSQSIDITVFLPSLNIVDMSDACARKVQKGPIRDLK